MQNNLTKSDLQNIDTALDKAILWYKEWKELNEKIETNTEDKFLTTYIDNRIEELTHLQTNIKWVI